MLSAIKKTLEYSNKLIVSPDIDGFMCAELLSRKFEIEVVGTYDKNLLSLADNIDPKDCLFVDCDMNTKDYVSIGNHMRLRDDNMADASFNPNTFQKVAKYSSKFPYATCFLVAATMEVPTNTYDHIRMAYADSTYLNKVNYADNMRDWSNLLPHPSIDDIDNLTEDIEKYKTSLDGKQAPVSRRLGLAKYMLNMNAALYNLPFATRTLTSIKKYEKGLIDRNTLQRYMSDIISYAEIFGGEYSVTYKDVVDSVG